MTKVAVIPAWMPEPLDRVSESSAMDGNYQFHKCLIVRYCQLKDSHPCDLDSGTNLSGTDLHKPEGRQAGSLA